MNSILAFLFTSQDYFWVQTPHITWKVRQGHSPRNAVRTSFDIGHLSLECQRGGWFRERNPCRDKPWVTQWITEASSRGGRTHQGLRQKCKFSLFPNSVGLTVNILAAVPSGSISSQPAWFWTSLLRDSWPSQQRRSELLCSSTQPTLRFRVRGTQTGQATTTSHQHPQISCLYSFPIFPWPVCFLCLPCFSVHIPAYLPSSPQPWLPPDMSRPSYLTSLWSCTKTHHFCLKSSQCKCSPEENSCSFCLRVAIIHRRTIQKKVLVIWIIMMVWSLT